MPICNSEGCEEKSRARGFCPVHYRTFMNYGRTQKIKLSNKNRICSVVECNESARRSGMCVNHYSMWRTKGRTEKLIRDKRKHPFYIIWFERKTNKCLSEEWLDFGTFVNDISPKPEGNFFLSRLRNEPYGPSNFEWREKERRRDGETKKEWIARQWTNQKLANPSMDSDRSIKRKYGLTRDDYNIKLEKQKFVCEICKEPEKSLHSYNGSIKKLAVDHCHTTGKIRDLLCGRCNSTIGRIEESVELLQSMIDYINKHKEIVNGTA